LHYVCAALEFLFDALVPHFCCVYLFANNPQKTPLQIAVLLYCRDAVSLCFCVSVLPVLFFSLFTTPLHDTTLGTPAGITRNFTTLTSAMLENGKSRIYAGVHFEFSNGPAIRTGRALGDEVFDNFERDEKNHWGGCDSGGGSDCGGGSHNLDLFSYSTTTTTTTTTNAEQAYCK
jgi:hypothetical protein